MILVISLELVLSDKTLEHRLDTLLILWHIQRQVQEIVESIRWFLAFRTDDSGSDLSSPSLVYPGSMLNLGWEVPISSVHTSMRITWGRTLVIQTTLHSAEHP